MAAGGIFLYEANLGEQHREILCHGVCRVMSQALADGSYRQVRFCLIRASLSLGVGISTLVALACKGTGINAV